MLCDRQVTKLLDGKVSHLPEYLVASEGGYIGCLGFTSAGFAEQARQAARRGFLPGSEGGGFGQNDVAVPSFMAWRKEAEAGRCLDSALACLGVIASQAFQATGRAAPPRLRPLLAALREASPPADGPVAPADGAAAVERLIRGKVFAGDRAAPPAAA